jgi:flavin-dependent dehydrogenase
MFAPLSLPHGDFVVEMNNSGFDLAVIGGGPAGTSAAITAAQMGASVVLFDGSDFPRQKVCGEFVSAESLELLRDLVGLHRRSAGILQEAPRIERARIFAANRVAETLVEPAGVSISRYVLDLLLWESAVQTGATANPRCEVRSIEGDGPFRLETSQSEVNAAAVVLCAGRWSRFSQVSAAAAVPKWVGLKAHYREHHPPQSTDLYFVTNGYCGVQPVGPDVVNVCAMVRSDVATSLPEVFQQSQMLSERAAGWEPVTSAITTAPLIYRQPEPTQGNLFLAGDAAAFIDPFAGDGISLALRTGRAAARSLGTFFAGRVPLKAAAQQYRAAYEREFAPLVSAAARVRRLHSLPEFAWPLAMQVLSIPGVLPYVIRRTRIV